MANQTSRQTPTLTTIPPELRLQIYTHLFTAYITETSTSSHQPLVPDMLHVSHLIRTEAMPIF